MELIASSAAPLTAAELAAALDPLGGFEAPPLVAVAVSGGPDSMALILLAERWARQRGGEAWALTVDHRLRPESAEEAQTVAGWLAARAIPHEILVWAGAKPASGIQEAAREARYRLLGQWCRAHGCLHLLTAHHREDQIETYLIRRRAGSGIDGLAGMSAVRQLPGCRLVRPLLSVPRARLLALLQREGQPFLLDPSNLNPAFERVRLRAEPPPGDFFGEVCACGAARIERERVLADLVARAVSLHPAGFATLEMSALSSVEAELAERLLGRVAATVGGARYPARRARLARLHAALMAAPDRARTLGGCRFVRWRGRFLVLRELAAASAPVPLEPGVSVVWDRRFIADLAPSAPRGLTLGYLGRTGASANARPIDVALKRLAGDLPRLIYPVLPALWDDEGLAAVPHLGYRRGGAGVPLQLFFRPANPLTQAGFTVV
ncbi:MAG TPA: tRNA lysidine(34) synthetase TilS [Stellaceae bacterium]|nr:tRNA lysidine(34) synthetase TilS [Stellaceae bacterium]